MDRLGQYHNNADRITRCKDDLFRNCNCGNILLFLRIRRCDMKITLLDRKSGEDVVKSDVSGIMLGVRWYWVEYANGTQDKIPKDEYLLVEVEA